LLSRIQVAHCGDGVHVLYGHWLARLGDQTFELLDGTRCGHYQKLALLNFDKIYAIAKGDAQRRSDFGRNGDLPLGG
jgi:hypothetical protein